MENCSVGFPCPTIPSGESFLEGFLPLEHFGCGQFFIASTFPISEFNTSSVVRSVVTLQGMED